MQRASALNFLAHKERATRGRPGERNERSDIFVSQN